MLLLLVFHLLILSALLYKVTLALTLSYLPTIHPSLSCIHHPFSLPPGIFTGQATTIMVATSDPTHPVRIVGDPAPNRPDRTEDPWWADKQISLSRRRSLERERVDNREPATATAGTAGVSGGASAGHSSKHTQ